MTVLRAVLACSLCLTACSGQSTSPANPQVLDFNQTIYLNGKAIQVAIFDTPTKREQGLMWVKELAPNYGALFIFEREDKVNFWMKNTLIPLDIYFFDVHYKLLKLVKAAQPCKESCEIYTAEPVIYALEVASVHNTIVK